MNRVCVLSLKPYCQLQLGVMIIAVYCQNLIRDHIIFHLHRYVCDYSFFCDARARAPKRRKRESAKQRQQDYIGKRSWTRWLLCKKTLSKQTSCYMTLLRKCKRRLRQLKRCKLFECHQSEYFANVTKNCMFSHSLDINRALHQMEESDLANFN